MTKEVFLSVVPVLFREECLKHFKLCHVCFSFSKPSSDRTAPEQPEGHSDAYLNKSDSNYLEM